MKNRTKTINGNAFPQKSRGVYPYSKPQNVRVLNTTICNPNNTIDSYQYASLDRIDLCTYYQYEHPALCELTSTQLRFNYDRGAALICDDKLAGILSVVIPANHSNASTIHCNATAQTNTYFTNTALYLDWIQSVILSKDSAEMLQGMPIQPNVPAYQSKEHPFLLKND